MEMEIKSWHVVEPLTRYDPPPEGGGDCNFCQSAQCRNPLWSERTRGNAVAAPLAVIFLDGNNEPTISVRLLFTAQQHAGRTSPSVVMSY